MSTLNKRNRILLTTTAILGTLAVYSSQAQAACPVNVFDDIIAGPIGAGGVYDTDVISSISITGSGSFTNGAGTGVSSSGSNPFILCIDDGGSVTGSTTGVIDQTEDVQINNAGSITGQSERGIDIVGSGTVMNEETGMIEGITSGVFFSGSGSSLSNAGIIDGSVFGIVLGAGGTVDNKVGGTITGGNNAVAVGLGEGNVTNAGVITSAFGVGVALLSGGAVDNKSGGQITGDTIGVGVEGATGEVINAGTIVGTNNQGVYLDQGGSVDNKSMGVITGGQNGVEIFGGTGTITNSGTILSNSAKAVYLRQGGSITNNAEGTIMGADIGIHTENEEAIVVNRGLITGVNTGVYLESGGSIDNVQDATIIGGTIGVALEIESKLTNSGEITGQTTGVETSGPDTVVINSGIITGNIEFGAFLIAGGTVNNLSGGSITGEDYGVAVEYAEGYITNAGTIKGNLQASVLLMNGGSVDNTAGGVLDGAVIIEGESGAVTNAGSISGFLRGVMLKDGGTVDNISGGEIIGGNFGVRGLNAPITVNNAGTITGTNNDGISTNSDAVINNLAGGMITGNNAAISIFGTGVVSNQGGIHGDVNFFTEDDTLHLMAGSSLIGDVDGDDGVDSLIVSGDHTLGKIINFENATINDGFVEWDDETVELNNLTVESGHLSFSGGADNVSVGTAGMLSGTGKFGDIALSGTIAPGNSAGVLTIAGDLTMETTAIYEAEIYADGTNDLIDVGGSANLNGSLEIDIADAPEDYEEIGIYTILTADGGVTGDFTTTTVKGGTATVYAMSEISGNDVNVNLVNPTEFFAGVGGTKNEKAASVALAGVAVSSTEAQSLFYANSNTVNKTLEELSGNSHATMANVIAQDGNEYMTAVKSEVRDTNQEGFTSWGKFYGMGGTAASDGNARGYKHDNSGMALGIGYAVTPEITVGLHGGHTWSNATFNNDVAKAKTKEFGAYVASEYKQFNAVAAYSHGWYDVKMSRVISLAGTALSNADTTSNKVQLEVSYEFKLGDITVAPVIGYNRTEVKSMTIEETGAGVANLSGTTDKFTSSQPKAGIRINMEAPLGDDGVIKPSAEVMFVSEQSDLNGGLIASSLGMPENSFSVSGLTMDKNRVEVDAGVEYETRGNISFSVGYRGTYMSRIKSHGGRASIKIKF